MTSSSSAARTALYTWILMRHFALFFIVYIIIIQMCRDTHQNKHEYSTVRTPSLILPESCKGKISETDFFFLTATVCREDWLNGGGRLKRGD